MRKMLFSLILLITGSTVPVYGSECPPVSPKAYFEKRGLKKFDWVVDQSEREDHKFDTKFMSEKGEYYSPFVVQTEARGKDVMAFQARGTFVEFSGNVDGEELRNYFSELENDRTICKVPTRPGEKYWIHAAIFSGCLEN